MTEKWIPTTDLAILRRMGKLIEETNELGSVAARVIIQGIDEVDPGTRKTNRQRALEEVADVYAQLDETVVALKLDYEAITARRHAKRLLMQEWEAMFKTDADNVIALCVDVAIHGIGCPGCGHKPPPLRREVFCPSCKLCYRVSI